MDARSGGAGAFQDCPRYDIARSGDLLLRDPDRRFFLIQRTIDETPLGRFYFRRWRFNEDVALVDWELNIFLAAPTQRGKGYGTEVQRLAREHLEAKLETHSVFAVTAQDNQGERRALEKAGFG